MTRFFQRQGSLEVEVLSEKRTDSPNIWWSNEQMRAHGFSECPGGAKEAELEDEKAVELMIAQKTRELAVSALKAEGKLNGHGKALQPKFEPKAEPEV